MKSEPKPKRQVQIRRDDQWIDLISAPQEEANEHVNRLTKELGVANVRLKPTKERP